MRENGPSPLATLFVRYLRLLCPIVALVISSSAFAQGAPPELQSGGKKWYVEYHGFQMLLEEQGLTSRSDLAGTLVTPRESVVLVFGNLDSLPTSTWETLRRFVGQGGALMVASERDFTLPGVCSFFSGPVSSTKAADRYKGFADCLGLSSLNQAHPLSRGLREIIVNKSGWLSEPIDDSLEWSILATFPGDCLPKAARGKPVLLAGAYPAPETGVFILCADQSLFSDGMLWHGDNSILAIQTADVLCNSGRKWLTVIVNSRAVGDNTFAQGNQSPTPPLPPSTQPPEQRPYRASTPEPPEPDLDTILKKANKVINAAQQSNILNESLQNRPRNIRPVAWLRTLLFILLILLSLFTLWKLVQTRWQVVQNRHSRFLQSMYGVHSALQMKSSEFGSAVEVLARDLCHEITGSTVEKDWLILATPEKNVTLARLPRTLRRELRDLAGIATRGCRIHISNRRFQSIGKAIMELRRRHRITPLVVLAAGTPADG